MKEMIVCPNCGAQIEKDITKCPYCGYINKEAAEKKFREDLGEIQRNIEETKKEPQKALVKGITGGTKVILIISCILILLAALFFVLLYIDTRDKPKLFLTAKEQEYASAYVLMAGEQLDEAYEEKDIQRMAEIFDKAYSEDRVSIWGVPHYEAGYASSCYMKLQQRIEDLDTGNISKKEAEELTYYCFYFYYRAYGDDGSLIFDPIRENEIIPIITDRLGYTEKDLESFKDKVWSPPYVDRSKVYKVTKKYFKNYK